MLQRIPIEEFRGERSCNLITKTCKTCRDSNKLNDKKRDKDHRNELARECAKNPENIVVKQQWTEANYDKVSEKWMNYRGRQIENNQEEYLKRNAECAKSWREKNPDKVKESNISRVKNVNINYQNYIRSARDKNLVFELSIEVFIEKVKEPCYYCGEIDEHKGFNGIDRMDQQVGYIVDNCVSCCQMCNYMKKSLNTNTFLQRTEHILVYNKLVEGRLHPECFADHLCIDFTSYVKRANDKGWEFSITLSDFYQITSNDCYICGKRSDKNHTNGMDRFDNSLPYIIENIKPCCGECNYMKNDYIYSDMIDKLKKIHIKNMDKLILINTNNFVVDGDNMKEEQNTFYDPSNETDRLNNLKESNRLKQQLFRERQIEKYGIDYLCEKRREKFQNSKTKNNIMVKTNKKTKEEINEAARLRKQKQRELQKEKYGDEEYKKMNAEQVAKNRAKKKEMDANK